MTETELQLKISLAKAGLERDATAAAAAIRRQLGDIEADITLKADDATVKKLSRAIEELADETIQTAQQAEFLKKAYNLSDREIDQVINKMRRLGDETENTKNKAGGLDEVLTGFLRGAGDRLLETFLSTLTEIVRVTAELTGRSLELARSQAQVKAALGAVFPTQEAVAEQLAFVREVADSTGGSFDQLSKEYSKFAAAAGLAGIATEDIQAVFKETARAGALFGASAADQNLILNALSQIASKGVVSMEELRQQLGERLPVAFKATADGLGITTAELNGLVESGNLTAQEFFPAITKGLQGIQGEADKTTIAIGQLSNNFNEGLTAFGDALLPLQNEILEFVNAVLLATGENFDGFGPITDATNRLTTALENAPEAVEAFGEVFGDMANAVVEQLALIIDAITAFVEQEGNVEQLAGQFEVLVDAIEAIGTVVRVLIGFADGIASVATAAESLPIVGDNFDRFLKFPAPFVLFQEVLRGMAEVIVLLKDAVIDAVDTSLDRLGRLIPVLEPIVDRVQQLLDRLRTPEPETVAPVLVDQRDPVRKQQEKAATPPPTPVPEPPDLSPIEDRYKALTAALEVEQANQIRVLVEGGKSREEIEAKEREFLQRRIRLNQQKADELRAIDASALDPKAREKLADTLLALDQKIAGDELKLAQDTRKAVEDSEKAKTKAAEDAAKARTKLADDAAKARDKTQSDREKAERDAERAAKAAADAEVKRQEEIAKAREKQIDAIEAEGRALVALGKVAADSAALQIDRLKLVNEELDRQADRLKAQSDLVQAVGDLQGAINDARADSLREIVADEEASDSKRRKAAGDLLSLTEQQFAQEKAQLEQRQTLELQAFDLGQQQAALAEQRAVKEQELALRRMELQKLEIANEVELARLRGDTRAIEVGQAQLALVDEQLALQAEYIASIKESAAASQEVGAAQRQLLLANQEGEDIGLANQQQGQARSVDQQVSGVSRQLDRRGDRLVDFADRARMGELNEAQGALPALLRSARPNPQIESLSGLGAVGAPAAIDLSRVMVPIGEKLDTLNDRISQLAASPRQLTVQTPDPVNDISKILNGVAQQAARGVNP